MGYRGGQLDGPNLRKLLDKLDELQSFIPAKFNCFVDCMRLFDDVAKACFGTILLSDYLEKIKKFERSYRKLGISITPKIHCIFYEVPIFIEHFHQPLGKFTAQPFESIHYEFLKIWINYKREENHPEYGQKLEDSVVCCNSDHIILQKI